MFHLSVPAFVLRNTIDERLCELGTSSERRSKDNTVFLRDLTRALDVRGELSRQAEVGDERNGIACRANRLEMHVCLTNGVDEPAELELLGVRLVRAADEDEGVEICRPRVLTISIWPVNAADNPPQR